MSRRQVTEADRALAARRRADYRCAAGMPRDQLERELYFQSCQRGPERQVTRRMLASALERRRLARAVRTRGPWVRSRAGR